MRRRYGRRTTRTRRFYSRRSGRGGYSRRPPHLGIGKALFPNRLHCKLFYNFNSSILSTNGGLGIHTFNLNSLFRPEVTTGGTSQPRFFDTLFGANGFAYPYQGYRVYGAKVNVRFYSDASSTSKLSIGARDDNITSAPGTIMECDERSMYSTKILGSNAGGPSVIYMNRYYDMSKLAGVSRRQYMDDDDYRGTYGTNPAERMVLDIMNCGVNGQTRTIYYDLRIVFYTVCLYGNDVADS